MLMCLPPPLSRRVAVPSVRQMHISLVRRQSSRCNAATCPAAAAAARLAAAAAGSDSDSDDEYGDDEPGKST